MTLEMISIFPL